MPMTRWVLAAAACIVGSLAFAAAPAAQPAAKEAMPVEVSNRSEPVLCAEKDNVAIALNSPRVQSLRIEAIHPAYIVTLDRDSYEPDWTDCNMQGDPVYTKAEEHRRETIYESMDLWLVAHTFKSFWRPAKATVRIDGRSYEGVHLLQLWIREPNGGTEVLVMYPQDGYWRPRPIAPTGMRTTAFGSSFLIGPVTEGPRPFVDITGVAFDPKSRTFGIQFAGGNSANVRLAEVDKNRLSLDVSFASPIGQRPFAMLRSMYITSFNNDVARIAWREKAARRWREDTIMNFKRATATDIWTGRIVPSRHNTSSPDILFKGFSETTTPNLPIVLPPEQQASSQPSASGPTGDANAPATKP